MGLANWLIFLILATKYPQGVFLRKRDSLSELGYRGFIAFLVVDWVCYIFVAVRSAAHGGDYGLEFYGGMCSEM